MGLQYIYDSTGKSTGVFIPIQEWNNLKTKYEGLEEEVYLVPEWQKEIVCERTKNTGSSEYQTREEVKKQLNLD